MSLSPREISVAVLDANDLLCDGLDALIRQTPGLVCVGAWTDVADALPTLAKAQPDILLLDLQMPERSALDLLGQLPALSSSTRVIVMVDCPEDRCIVLNPKRCCDNCQARTTGCAAPGRIPDPMQPATDDCLQTALKMGACGAMQKRRRFLHIAEGIRNVHAGSRWMELPTARRLAQQYLGVLATPSPADRLTPRERDIAALIALGHSNKEICQELNLGYSTVKNYVSSILEKLDLRDRTQIALYAMERALPAPGKHPTDTGGLPVGRYGK